MLLLPSCLILLKVCLLKFLLPNTSFHLSKKLQDVLKDKNQFEESKQGSEPESDIAGILDLSDQKFF